MKKTILFTILVLMFTLSIAAAEPIVEAAKNGDFQVVKNILKHDPSKLDAKNEDGYTALHWACMRAQWGMTELHTAIWRGNIHVVGYLLDHGSDPNIKTNEGWTAMHYAYRSGHDKVIELLKIRGVSMTAKDNMGRTPQYLYFKKPNPIALSEAELDEYHGKYYVGDYLLLEVWREGNRLKIMEFGPDEIYPVAKDFFYFKHAPWTLIFSRDEEGKVHHAQLSFIRRSYKIVKR